MADLISSEATAIRMLASGNLHQSLWLPATASHEKLRVTFSTTSNFDDESLPVVLFIGPMFGTRYLSLMFDKLAQSEGLRVICVDKPGNGGSSAVPVDKRITTWLETVPILLRHLHVQHVHLVTHSAGTIYTMNTLADFRDILDPQAPYVAFLGPWVHSDHSAKALWKAASMLPAGLISRLSDVTEFMQQTVMPATSWSGGVFSFLSSPFQAAATSDADKATEYQEQYGVNAETGKLIDQLQSKYAFAEGMAGGGEDAVLCAKKAGKGAWGSCEDYQDFTRTLAGSEKERQDAARLRVRLHFAGSDVMIGKGGQEYFELCWKQVAETIDVESTEWPEANHDGVLIDFAKGALRTVFAEIGHLHNR